MKTPRPEEWDLLTMGLLDEQRAAELRRFVAESEEARECFAEAHRQHVDITRCCETFTRDHDRYREQLLATLPTAPERSQAARSSSGVWHYGGLLMKSRTTRRISIALLPAACVVFLIMLVTTSDGKIALADTYRLIREARTVTLSMYMASLGASREEAIAEGIAYRSVDHGAYSDFKHDDMDRQILYESPGGHVTRLNPARKTFKTYRRTGPRYDPQSVLSRLQRLGETPDENLGRSEIDGRQVVGYAFTGEQVLEAFPETKNSSSELGLPAAARLWLDVGTKLPVRLELDSAGPTRVTAVYYDMRWNVKLHPDLFTPLIPEDYEKVPE